MVNQLFGQRDSFSLDGVPPTRKEISDVVSLSLSQIASDAIQPEVPSVEISIPSSVGPDPGQTATYKYDVVVDFPPAEGWESDRFPVTIESETPLSPSELESQVDDALAQMTLKYGLSEIPTPTEYLVIKFSVK